MARKHIQRSGHQAELVKLLHHIAHRHSLWTVFRDFVAMAALTLSNASDPWQREAREAEYMAIVGRYSRDEANRMAQAFAHVVDGLETGHHDFLGSLFMTMKLGDSWKGQFFTPYEVCLCMAKMNMNDAAGYIDRQGFIRVSDPCVGGGAMIIAAAHALQDKGINYQQCMHAVAQDIDLTAVHMAYIQFSLLHIPAIVVHGNSLVLETRSTWRTLAHMMGHWNSKLERRRLIEAATEAEAELVDVEPAGTPLFTPSADAVRHAANPIPTRGRRVSAAEQISLF